MLLFHFPTFQDRRNTAAAALSSTNSYRAAAAPIVATDIAVVSLERAGFELAAFDKSDTPCTHRHTSRRKFSSHAVSTRREIQTTETKTKAHALQLQRAKL